MYFDSHAHLNDPCFDEDREAVIEKIKAAQVSGMLNIGCCHASSLDCIAMAEKYDWVWAAIGTHPDTADEVDEALIETYRGLCSHPRVKAIGEIGLDYHYETVPREIQKRAFRLQMELAQELNMPVVIHEREAHGDAMEILYDFPTVTGVFHCYSGSLEMAKELVRRGWSIGFTGVVTFKNARKAVEVAEWLPLDRMLIETDCPFMAPEPHRGRRNDPSFVPLVAQKIAQLRGLTPEQVAEATTQNAHRLFRLDE